MGLMWNKNWIFSQKLKTIKLLSSIIRHKLKLIYVDQFLGMILFGLVRL